MKDLKPTCRIAVVQTAPVLFDKTACTDKAVHLIAECARSGAELIVFPELFIPGYPYGMTFGFTVGARNEDGRKDWQLYCDNSIVVPGPETERLAAAAKAAGAYVSIGVSERDGVTGIQLILAFLANVIAVSRSSFHCLTRLLDFLLDDGVLLFFGQICTLVLCLRLEC